MCFDGIDYVPNASPPVGAGTVFEHILIIKSLDATGIEGFLAFGQ